MYKNWHLVSDGLTLVTRWVPDLKIAQVRARCVQEANRRELYSGVETHILEAAEASHQGSSTFP